MYIKRGTRIDLDASRYGFIEDRTCTLTFILQGHCLATSGRNEQYCQPLLGFGDGTSYFIASYLVSPSTSDMTEIKVYPKYGDNEALARGNITSMLTIYNGTEHGRDAQFYDAVTALHDNGSYAFSSLRGTILESSWPIELNIHRKEMATTIELGYGNAHWSTLFEANSSLHFGILNQLNRNDLDLNIGAFTIKLPIKYSRECSPAAPKYDNVDQERIDEERALMLPAHRLLRSLMSAQPCAERSDEPC